MPELLPFIESAPTDMSTILIRNNLTRKLTITAIIICAVTVAALSLKQQANSGLNGSPISRPPTESNPLNTTKVVRDLPESVRAADDFAANPTGLQLEQVVVAGKPLPLLLSGRLTVDPNRLIHVRTRFRGEAVSIGTTGDEKGARQLRFGDHVKKGRLLAIVWSKDVGEKKSELLSVSSRLKADRSILSRLESLPPGIVSQRSKDEAHCQVESDLIAVGRAERTLRSWRIGENEIGSIYQELESIHRNRSEDSLNDRRWAETEIRAAIDGVIVEKNFNAGDIVETNEDLFKIADLTHLRAVVDVREEDLRTVRQLPASERRWVIHASSDANRRISGCFDQIGCVIDPNQRTGTLMGDLDNSDEKMAVGELITAAIQLPIDPRVVAIPESALIENGKSSSVFVAVGDDHRKFTRRSVTVIRRGLGTADVLVRATADDNQGVSLGERVVARGAWTLDAVPKRIPEQIGRTDD